MQEKAMLSMKNVFVGLSFVLLMLPGAANYKLVARYPVPGVADLTM